MDKHAAALVLDEIGTLLELLGDDPFRPRAYFGAARALDRLDHDPVRCGDRDALAAVKGLGPATLRVIDELLETGASSLHRELRERTPAGVVEMLAIPGLGPRRVRTIHERLGVETLDALEAAAEAGRIAELPKFGPKTEASILEGIRFLRATAGRRRLPDADAAARRVAGWLGLQPDVERALIAGALRRRVETVDAVELLVVTRAQGSLEARLRSLPGAARVEPGPRGPRAWLADGLEIRLRAAPPDRAAAAYVLATGSDAHIAGLGRVAEARGLRLEDDGLWAGEDRIPLEDEAGLYGRLGLTWIPPELREGLGEIEAAAEDALPALVRADDLRGTFHCHTTYSDGKATLAEMAEAALERGWRYLGIADHSQAAAYAGGLAPEDVARQRREIDAWNEERGDALWLFHGIEADILADGTLDYAAQDGAVLERLDYVVGSVHASFTQTRAQMTARLERALASPRLTFLGHATGRLLLRRDGYELDLDAVLDAAASSGAAIEINADPARLDLDWRHWPAARERGILTAINPDAHSTAGLDNVAYGIGVARKGWLEAGDVINSWDLEDVKAHFERRTH